MSYIILFWKISPKNSKGRRLHTGVFTTLLVRQGKIENGLKHLKRLCAHSKQIGFDWPSIDSRQLRNELDRFQISSGTWRLKITIEAQSGRPSLFLGALPYVPVQKSTYRLKRVPAPSELIHPNLKSTFRGPHNYVRQEARRRGYDDGLLAHADGLLLETSCANLFWIDRGVLYTPAPCLGLLEGTCLCSVRTAAGGLGLRVQEVAATLEEVPRTAQVYVCNALIGIQPVDAIDGFLFSRDSLSAYTLSQATAAVIAEDTYDFSVFSNLHEVSCIQNK